jgi:hypothetical protein
MSAADPAPSRFAAARATVLRDMQAAPSGTTFTIVTAGSQPRVVVSTNDLAQAERRLQAITPVAAFPDLGKAVAIAAGVLPARQARMLIVYARGETLPAISAPPGVVTAEPIGNSTDNQSISAFSVRCAANGTTCNAFANVRNLGVSAVQDNLVVEADGAVLGQEALNLGAQSASDLSFQVPASRHIVQLFLTRRDLVGSDNLAWAVVPGAERRTVTVVGDTKRTAPVVKAFAAVPNVRVVALTPPQFQGSAASSGLVVLVGWLPAGPLPSVPGLLLISPPRLPGGGAASPLYDTTVSGQDTTSPLLSGVDLTSLDVPPGTAERLTLPPAVQRVVWSAAGPLISSGVDGGRRIVVFSFDPSVSNLSQLSAFPLLASNVLDWTTSWLPAQAVPGDTLTVDVPPATTSVYVTYRASLNAPPAVTRYGSSATTAYVTVTSPGAYTVTERGAWGVRGSDIAVNTSAGAPTTVVTPIAMPTSLASANVTEAGATKTVWWPLLGLLAALIIAAEWLIALTNRAQRG